MKSIIIILTIISFSCSAQSTKTYACTPCGYDCDSTEYHSAGTCSSCGMALVDKSTIHFENISFLEMCIRLQANKDILLLDVRSPGEFSGENKEIESFGHFKNAININVDQLPSRISELKAYKDKEVVVYCSHNHRSPRATYLLTNSGFKNVTNVSGGVSVLKDQFGNNSCLQKIFISH